MGIDFKLEPLDCEPFYHGYGEKCSDAEITIGLWRLQLTDLKGNVFVIPFYMTKGNGLLLLGNEVLSKSDILNTKGILRIPVGSVNGLKTEVTLPTYTTEDVENRTHPHVVPSQTSKFRSYFASSKSLYGSERGGRSPKNKMPKFMGKTAKDFERKLHLYSHLPLRDMKDLCKRGGILHPVLHQALQTTVDNKIGSVESGNATLRKLAVRLLKDAQHEKDTKGVTFTSREILYRAVLASNIHRGRKKLSAFELARGYLPPIVGFPKTLIESAIMNACYEQIVHRALTKLINEKSPDASNRLMLCPKTKVFFYEKKGKQAVWKTGFVHDPKEHFVEITRGEYGHGKRLKIVYEDIRLFPSSSLLEELDQIEIYEERKTETVPMEEEEADSVDTPAHTDSSPKATNTTSNEEKDKVHTLLGACGEDDQKGEPDILVSTPRNTAQKDIGDTVLNEPRQNGQVFESQEQEVLRQLREVIGDEPVTESRLQFAPRWIIEKAIQKEKDNYTDKRAYEEVNNRSLPKNANIISSHCSFQVKYDGESSKLKLKCRLVPHGNKDKEKDNIRKDSSTAQFPAIRSLLSAAVVLQFRLATIDISGAFLQSGPIQRDVYVRLPKGWTRNAFTIWKLLVPAYSLVESGRLWQLAVEECMMQNGMLPVEGMTQVFTRRNKDDDILLIVAKVVDEFLIAGLEKDIEEFNDAISKRFKVGRFTPGPDLVFNRLHIHQDSNYEISVSVEEYFEKIQPISIDQKRRKEQDSKCTLEELKLLQALAGQLNWLGHGVLPPAALVSSLMQQWTGDLWVKHLCKATRVLHEMRSFQASIRYNVPEDSEKQGKQAAYIAFSDASQGKGAYGQTGHVFGIFFSSSRVHILEWHSSKQCRVSFSSIVAGVLAAAESADRASLMCHCLHKLYGVESSLPLVLTVDSHGLYSTITTLHEGRDYRLRLTVARLRDSFEAREIYVLHWVKGTNNIAEAWTKRNLDIFRKINEACVNGVLFSDIFLHTERITKN